MAFMMFAVILVIIGFDLVIKWLTVRGLELGAVVILRLFHGLACLSVLVIEFGILMRQRLRLERDTMSAVLAEREHQYQASQESVAAINARVHDIRHAIGRLGDDAQIERDVLAEIIRAVDLYDSSVHTGNTALDTALAEKGLIARHEGIALACIANGHLLDFMTPADVYSLADDLLSSALAMAQGQEGASISFSLREALGSKVLHVECPTSTSGEAASLSTACVISERYDGTLSSGIADGAWQATVLFPQM